MLRADLDAAETAEWVLRIILSLLTIEAPRHHSPEDERRLMTTYVIPALLPTSALHRSDARLIDQPLAQLDGRAPVERPG